MLQRLYSVSWTFKLILAGATAIGGIWGWQAAQPQFMTLVALDTDTGAVQWFQPLRSGDDFFSRGAIAAGGIVIVESAQSSVPEQKFDTYRLQAFAAQSGERLWVKQLDAPEGETSGFGYLLAANPIVDLQPTALYMQTAEELRSLDPTTGKQRWAIKRPWFNTGPGANLWIDLGVAAAAQKLAVLQLNPRQQLIQILDAATGNTLRQTPISSTDQLTNFSLIRQTNSQVFTVGQVRSENNANGNERSALTAYNMDTGQIRFRTQFGSDINNLQAVGKAVQLSTDAIFNTQQPDRQVAGRVLALDSQTGRLLWQQLDSELQCFDYRSTWQADDQALYLNCKRRRNDQDSSTIVALSAQTGQVQWQSQISSNWHSDDVPLAISSHQLLMLRQVRQGDHNQTQAIALDRQTGTLLWAVALFEERSLFFRSRIATERDRVFILDAIPRWQLWLLQMNRSWYLKSPVASEEN